MTSCNSPEIFRSGENGRELQKGDKYDWKQEGDTYTLYINNPVLEDDGTYILVVKEVDAKTGGYLTVKKRDPEYWFVRPLKEQELGYTNRPYSMSVEMSEPGVNLKWLKNNAPIVWSEVNCVKKDEGNLSHLTPLWPHGQCFRLYQLHLLPQLCGGRHELLQRHHLGVRQERREGSDGLLVPGLSISTEKGNYFDNCLKG